MANNPSLPVRGAWIEMLAVQKMPLKLASLPVRGAWIEITKPDYSAHDKHRRSPCGERGLKSLLIISRRDLHKSLPVRGAWIEIIGRKCCGGCGRVAPRAGSVD